MILVDIGVFVSAADRDEPRHTECAELLRSHRDLGFVDASIVTVAERLDVTTIATLNRRDFAVVRPRHCDALDLIP